MTNTDTDRDERPRLGAHQKALKINLDPLRYGTFAEIGAGQEVARWFFKVGAAAGSISKTISAYDMTVSDAIYGKCKRYVSRERLQSMMDHEHGLNLERLRSSRGDNTAFFAFADTVAARNYQGTNECHGWMGVKFQAHPRDADSQITIHVRMLDHENSLQQEALGIVGVNLLYAAFFLHHKPEWIIESLLDNLTTERIEIDMIEFSGIEFRHVDNRVMSLKLVQLGLSDAAMFGPSGEVLQPSEVLRKRPVLVERGSFRPVTKVNIDMIRAARERFSAEPDVSSERIAELMEITMRNLLAEGKLDLRDFLARADVLAAAGKTVLISDYFEYYRLAGYLARYTKDPIAVVMGAASLKDLFTERYYTNLEGGILEAFGKLFTKDLRLYVYPLKDPVTGEIFTVENIAVSKDVRNLYSHLVDHGRIKPLDNVNYDLLHIYSRDVLARIANCDESWETMVPEEIAQVIKGRKFFGYQDAVQ
ncbi:MAG: TonB-dependent receptor [Acidobacteria bacterium]|nr:TonB-dependent receptor [Acidobacteriota bacterium]